MALEHVWYRIADGFIIAFLSMGLPWEEAQAFSDPQALISLPEVDFFQVHIPLQLRSLGFNVFNLCALFMISYLPSHMWKLEYIFEQSPRNQQQLDNTDTTGFSSVIAEVAYCLCRILSR